MVDILFIARMCGATSKDAASVAWEECSPDSALNKKRRRERTERKRAKIIASADKRIASGKVLFDGRPVERDWWPLRARILERDSYACVYCGNTDADAPLCADHVVPLSRGGTNDESNLVCACIPCNSSKNNRLLSEWKGRYQ